MTDPSKSKISLDDLSHLVAASQYGFTAGFDFLDGIPAEIVSTFPADWLQIYQTENFVVFDPVVVWGTEFTGVKNWDELKSIYRHLEPDVIGRAREYGMSNGSVISLVVNGRKGIVGITHPETSLPEDTLTKIVGQMSLVLMRMASTSSEKITPKGRQYLELSSQGKTDHEIADYFGVTYRSVGALRNRTIESLGAATTAQAIRKALYHRLLD